MTLPRVKIIVKTRTTTDFYDEVDSVGIKILGKAVNEGTSTVYQKHSSLQGRKAEYGGRRLLTGSTSNSFSREQRAAKERD